MQNGHPKFLREAVFLQEAADRARELAEHEPVISAELRRFADDLDELASELAISRGRSGKRAPQ